jgi:hypothetical protein
MKKKRRRELRENELARQLGDALKYLNEQWQWLAGGALVIVVIAAVAMYWRYNAAQRRDEGLSTLMSLRESRTMPVAEKLQKINQVANEYGDKDVVLAALEMASRITTEDLLLGALGGQGPVDRNSLLDEQAKAAHRIVSEFGDHPEAVARAHLALAAVAEDRGEADEARRHYQAILDDPKLKATMYASTAAARESTLEARMEPVTILPALAPGTQPSTQATTSRAAATQAAGAATTEPAAAPGVVSATQPVE